MPFADPSAPIPPHLAEAFAAYLRTHDDPYCPAGEWVDLLQSAAEQFMLLHHLPGEPVDAVGQYIGLRQGRPVRAG